MANPLKMLKLKPEGFQFILELPIEAPPAAVWKAIFNIRGWFHFPNMPADHAPYVGRLWPFSSRVWTATGFQKWGLAMSIVGALLCQVFAGPFAAL